MKIIELRKILEECMDDSDIAIVTENGSIVDFCVDRFEYQKGSLLLFPIAGQHLEQKILNQIHEEFARISEENNES